jgi:peptide deformylase
MAILKVARMGHPVLRTRARPVPPAEIASPRIQRLIDDMFETMHEYAGIGLAGPQVHESLQLFVAGVPPSDPAGAPAGTAPAPEMSDDADMPLIALVNPEVTLVGEADHEGWEGCLSIPDIRGLVPRAREVRVTALGRDGRRLELRARGLPARVIQHESDHLQGVLFFDRMASFRSLTFIDEFRRYWTDDPDEE